MDPARYLEQLEWDGKARLDGWLTEYLGSPSEGAAYGSRWLISAAARALAPGCAIGDVLVLQGPQGIGKTRTLQELCRIGSSAAGHEAELYSQDIDPKVELPGPWIVELTSAGPGDGGGGDRLARAAVKDLVRNGRCVFAATATGTIFVSHFLRGMSVCVVPVPGPVRIGALIADRDQLWAEAAHRYQQGERYYDRRGGRL
jgi:predicted P-loop ATPase